MIGRCLAAILAILVSAPSAFAFCALEPGEQGVVAGVVDGETLTLDSGLAVRLIGALAPRGPSGERTRTELARIALAKPVRLFYGGRRRDRHGRALAHAFVTGDDGRTWIQGRLVEAGFAVVYSFVDDRACVADLLEREAAARSAGRGLWGEGTLEVVDGLDLETLIAAEHRFAIVEGVVHAAAEARGRVYLNFEADWRRDFTVAVAPRDRRAFEKQGVDLMALKGRRIRARGWIVRRNGPMIEADHAEQVELVE